MRRFNNHMFVISGPSGVGKSTLVRRALEADPALRFSVSYTTRPRRPGERDGVHYHFVDESQFKALLARGELIEHARFGGHWYGNSSGEIHGWLSQGYDVIKDVDTQGAAQLRGQRDGLDFPVRFVFILPPSEAELVRRIRARGTEDPGRVEERLRIAKHELAQAPWFDVRIVNDDLDKAFERLYETIRQAREALA